MVTVPGGVFLMGSARQDDPSAYPNGWVPNPDEFPQHQVTIDAFAIGRTEVTQAQWLAVMGRVPSFNRGAGLPVETVSWNDVQKFIAKLNEMTGKTYRLPTEAEWEHAARAGATTTFYFGDDPSVIGKYAWFGANSGKKAHPVGEKIPNAFGLHDMHGNVWEWVQDCYMDSYGDAPADGRAVEGPVDCERVIRDGSGVDFPKSLRAAERFKAPPDYRNGNLGFRLAMDRTAAN